MEDLEKEGSDNFDIKKLQYKLPKASVESQTSIQNVYFTNDPNMIQILAIDFIKNLLIMATWDINNDYETNMI
jgi:hypothetical protein